jgi:hypothetical protein
MAISLAQINSIKDFTLRTVLLGMLDQHLAVGEALGINVLAPTNSPQKPASAPPPPATLSVAGANGSFNYAITNPAQSINKTIYHELSRSSQSSFVGGSGVTTLPVTTDTKGSVPAPGVTEFWRIRSSYDQNNWNSYQVLPGPISAGLQSSAASEAATVLNQTNYANVDSVSNVANTSANVRIYGKAGLNTQFPSVKGPAETILPSATLINVPFATEQVIGFDAKDYVARGTLPEVLADGITPIGAVSVVGSGAIVLPVVTVTIGALGEVTSWNVVSQGNALSDPVNLSIASAGSGAIPGLQTIVAGQLISIANGTGGSGYPILSTQPVTVTGGIFAGATGGGRNIGGNGGRLVVNDGTTG